MPAKNFDPLALTSRQQEVLDFIIHTRLIRGLSPSMQEIAEHFDFRSANAAQCHVDSLVKKGALIRVKGMSRGVVPVKELSCPTCGTRQLGKTA